MEWDPGHWGRLGGGWGAGGPDTCRRARPEEAGRGDRDYDDRDRDGHRRRRRSSGGGLVDNIKDRVEGFLNPDDGKGDKRRSRSHVGTTGSRRSGYDSYSDEERYERRTSKGGSSRRDRDDYY